MPPKMAPSKKKKSEKNKKAPDNPLHEQSDQSDNETDQNAQANQTNTDKKQENSIEDTSIPNESDSEEEFLEDENNEENTHEKIETLTEPNEDPKVDTENNQKTPPEDLEQPLRRGSERNTNRPDYKALNTGNKTPQESASTQIEKSEKKAQTQAKKIRDQANTIQDHIVTIEEQSMRISALEENLRQYKSQIDILEAVNKEKKSRMETAENIIVKLQETIKGMELEHQKQVDATKDLQQQLVELRSLKNKLLDKITAQPQPSHQQKKLLFIADSNRKHIANKLSQQHHWTIIDDIFTTQHLLNLATSTPHLLKPYQAIIIMLGTNDIKNGSSYLTSFNNIKQATNIISTHNIPSYVIQIPPLKDPSLNIEVEMLNRLIQNHIKPAHPIITEQLTEKPIAKIISHDGIHITIEAAEIIASAINNNMNNSPPNLNQHHQHQQRNHK